MKIIVTGNAYVATTSIAAEDIKLVKKYKPEALKVTDEEGNELFAMGYVEGKSGVGKNYITFGGTSRTSEGKATLTGLIPAEKDPKEYVAELFGAVIPYVNKMEEAIPAVVREVKENRQKLLDSIEVVG